MLRKPVLRVVLGKQLAGPTADLLKLVGKGGNVAEAAGGVAGAAGGVVPVEGVTSALPVPGPGVPI